MSSSYAFTFSFLISSTSTDFSKFHQRVIHLVRAQNFLKNQHFCAYQGVRNVCFTENFAHILYEWFQWLLNDTRALSKLKIIGYLYLYFKFCFVYILNVKLQIGHVWNLNYNTTFQFSRNLFLFVFERIPFNFQKFKDIIPKTTSRRLVLCIMRTCGHSCFKPTVVSNIWSWKKYSHCLL